MFGYTDQDSWMQIKLGNTGEYSAAKNLFPENVVIKGKYVSVTQSHCNTITKTRI